VAQPPRDASASSAPTEPTQATKPDFRQLGISGTRLFAGLISEEEVPQLQGQNAYRSFKGMRNDATCSALLKAVELPIRSARWFVNPASDDPRALEIADFVHDNLYNFGQQSMDDVLRLALGMMTWGFAWLELMYGYIDQGPWKGKVGWTELAYRSQATVWRWDMEWMNGRRQLVSVTQMAPPFYKQTAIPRNKLLIFTNDQEGDNWAGQSLLRPAWKDYFIRDRLYRIRAIGLERAYMGVPVASLPEGFTDEMRDLARNIVESLRVDEQAGVVKPEDLMLEILKGEIQGPAMTDAIKEHNRNILVSGLAQFLDLGSGQAGAYALSSDHSELFIEAINAKANYVSENFNLDPGIPSLARMNFSGVDEMTMPKLQHGDIGQRSLDRLGRTLMALGQWGFLTPNDPTEERLRQMLDLPPLDRDVNDRALYDLIQEVFPTDLQYGSGELPPRLPSPLSTADKLAGAKVTQAKAQAARGAAGGGPGTGPTMPAGPVPRGRGRGARTAAPEAEMGEYAYRFAEARSRFSEVMARRRWDRPPAGRLTSQDRMRIQLTEEFADALSDFKGARHARPQRPSEAAAQRRRPYVVRGAESSAQQIEPGQPRALATRQMALAKRRETGLADLLAPRGRR
jgi:hypothetical protein